ncbi:type 2 lanthipeptide synthetase LanM family protein [Oleiagrimonas soli]|uniref:Type 2 lantibiotic biosynthesis protein LanM n=1 Tax=Oleiagrimonas soli TaxID=1543381 RepID=A0A841KG51_9GAMM|nr:type 2 lanthipeptide synthetase LanM family protein [Oleiagrimonas soli]MBB6184162.1 type 2 lantibiotic biosynthesis protein LanM [Oleiagrimonas soli]
MSTNSFSSVLDVFAADDCARFDVFLEQARGLDASARAVLRKTGFEALQSEANASLLRVLLLELHAAQLMEQLPKGDSDSQFRAFVRMAEQPDFARHLDVRYPVLRERLACVLNDRRMALQVMIERVLADRERLQVHFGMDCRNLTALHVGLGDAHDRGHTVARLEFADGMLMYKPRPLRLDVALDAFLQRVFPGDHARIRVPRALDCGEYGWTEFTVHRFCDGEAEVSQFYFNLGRWIAVLHLLSGSDIHCENLIACGPVPVIVDPECLFGRDALMQDDEEGIQAEAARLLSLSVLRSGIAPYRSSFEALGGVDHSSMAASGDGTSEVAAPVLVGEGTAQARIAPGTIKLDAPRSLPTPENRFMAYAERILEGFAQTSDMLRSLDAAGRLAGLLVDFRGCRVRDLYRPTHVYSEVKRMLWHPASLHQPDKARARAEEILGGHADLTQEQIEQELRSLEIRDVPVYRSTVDDARLETALRLWRSQAMSAQEMILRASMVAAVLNRDTAVQHGTSRRRAVVDGSLSEIDDPEAERRRLAAWAVRRLQKLAIPGRHGSPLWVCPVRGLNGWMIEPLHADFYNGLGGIAYALAGYRHEMVCGRVPEVDGVEQTLEEVITAWRSMERVSTPPRGGGFNGAGSRILAWLTLYTHLERPEFLDHAIGHARALSCDEGDAPREFDLIAGEAGLILPLLQLGEVTGDMQWFEQAASIGRTVAAAAVVDARGARWNSPSFKTPIGGFAHGATGIGWALARLSLSRAGTAADRYRWMQLAECAFAFESTLYDQVQGAWRDMRTPEDAVCASAWCHGAIGIGLAASDLHARTGGKGFLETFWLAVESALEQGWHLRPNLCHGSIGMRELLARAARSGLETGKQARDHGDRIVLSQVRHIAADERQLTESLFVPGLMTGLSGIVHGLCRMSDEHELPSALQMEVTQTMFGAGVESVPWATDRAHQVQTATSS